MSFVYQNQREVHDIAIVISRKRQEGATEEECIEYATKKMTSDFTSVPEDTCKAVVEWVNTKFTPKAGERGTYIYLPSDILGHWRHRLGGEMSEDLRKERTNPTYDYLRNLQDPKNMYTLEALIGKFIDIPVFEERR